MLKECRVRSFQPTQTALAHRAQQVAIDGESFSSMNAALYILSRGPWIPNHISLHVRQAALAAVGAGWSWCNQIPTAFPFDMFDASLSIATLDNVPSRHTPKVDAMFDIFQTLCDNLSQPTRCFMFSKWEVKCANCAQVTEAYVEQYTVDVKRGTTFSLEDIVSQMQPQVNPVQTRGVHTENCTSNQLLQVKCIKMAPLILIRLLLRLLCTGCIVPAFSVRNRT